MSDENEEVSGLDLVEAYLDGLLCRLANEGRLDIAATQSQDERSKR